MLLNHADIMETVNMISQQHLDIRTITMGITLLDCADPNPQAAAGKIYDKICRCAFTAAICLGTPIRPAVRCWNRQRSAPATPKRMRC